MPNTENRGMTVPRAMAPKFTRGLHVHETLIFLISFGLWVALFTLHRSQFRSMIFSRVSYDSVRHFCLSLLVVYELLFGRRDLKSNVGLVVVAVLARLIVWFNPISTYFFDGLFYIYVGRDIPLRQTVTVFFVLVGGLLLITIAAAWLGIIPNYSKEIAGRGVRYFLGFRNPNNVPVLSVFVLAAWLYLREEHFTVWDAIGIMAIAGILYHWTNSRTAFFLSGMLMASVVLMRLLPDSVVKSKFMRVAVVSSIAIAAFVSLWLCDAFDRSVEWMANLDSLLSMRLGYAHAALGEFGISLSGEHVMFTSSGTTPRNPAELGITLSWIILDNLYVRFFINFGVVFSLVSIGICMYVFDALWKEQQRTLLAIVLVFVVFGLSEVAPAILVYNPFLFLLSLPLAKRSTVAETSHGLLQLAIQNIRQGGSDTKQLYRTFLLSAVVAGAVAMAVEILFFNRLAIYTRLFAPGAQGVVSFHIYKQRLLVMTVVFSLAFLLRPRGAKQQNGHPHR